MSESIAEMVIPGTYIEVRAEGLISVGAIATGNIGIVGTAARGPVNRVLPIGSLAEASAAFGEPDRFSAPRLAGSPLSLVRALEQAYAGGARNVFAVRVANGDPTPATRAIRAVGDTDAFTLTARGAVDADGVAIANSSGTWGQEITVELVDDRTGPAVVWRMTLVAGSRREVHTGGNVTELHASLRGSALVAPVEAAPANPTSGLDVIRPAARLAGGTDGADAGAGAVAAGLAQLATQPVNILLVAGLGANVVGSAVQAHVDATEADGRERIAVIGARSAGDATSDGGILLDTAATADDRIVLVAPGLVSTETTAAGREVEVRLPPPYLAAAVAGKLSQLAPQVSLTNKALPVVPDVRYSTALLQNLLQNRVLLVRQKFGSQVVKGISTDPGPFKQISIRRIVDFAKAGVRSGADPYIGRLNNTRVRAALKATLDGFLSQMVLDEMLVGYTLDVTATRAQERAGICSVVMTLQPTFSIDFIRVTMNLE